MDYQDYSLPLVKYKKLKQPRLENYTKPISKQPSHDYIGYSSFSNNYDSINITVEKTKNKKNTTIIIIVSTIIITAVICLIIAWSAKLL